MPASKEELFQFLKYQKGGVLATVSKEGHPDASFVYYACNEDLNIYFITSKTSQKFQNIKHDSRIAFVVTDELNLMTVQGKGMAKVVDDAEENKRVYDLLIQILHEKLENWPPPFAKMADAQLVILKITFTDLRRADFKFSGSAPTGEFYDQIIRSE